MKVQKICENFLNECIFDLSTFLFYCEKLHMSLDLLKFHCSYVSGGTCGGDSGGPFLTSVEDLDTFEIKTVQLGVLHGGLLPCTNTRFPAIYTRLDHPEIHAWLLDQITTKGKCLLQIYLRSRCL